MIARTRNGLALAALAGLALAACASQPAHRDDFRGRGGEGRGPGGPDARPQASLFISPSGKPYRAKPGEPYPVSAWFADADKDRDGKLTLIEFEANSNAFFQEFDTNHDGVVNSFEVEYYEQHMAPEILGLTTQGALETQPGFRLAQYGGRGGGGRRGQQQQQQQQQNPNDQGGGPQTLEGAGPYSLLSEPEPVANADANFDSKITPAEFKSAADRRFVLLDVKKLGYLTLDGLPKTAVQSRGGRGRGGPGGGAGRRGAPAGAT